jgi:hypothetical protein
LRPKTSLPLELDGQAPGPHEEKVSLTQRRKDAKKRTPGKAVFNFFAPLRLGVRFLPAEDGL